ncbi:MAG: SCP2 sterol-binding domain-containing protein [Acidimicrobiales bacterium]
MGKWLTEEWIADTKELGSAMPERPGMTATINYVITGAPSGDVEYFWAVVDGRLADAGIGRSESGDVSLTISYGDAKAMQIGELDANTAFMQGKIGVGGDLGKLLELLPLTSSQEYRTLEATLASRTDFSD